MTTGTPPLLQRLDKLAEAHERHEQGGGASLELREAAEAIRKLLSLLQACECAVSTHKQTGADTYRCPLCTGGGLYGLPARHDADCQLAAALRAFECEDE